MAPLLRPASLVLLPAVSLLRAWQRRSLRRPWSAMLCWRGIPRRPLARTWRWLDQDHRRPDGRCSRPGGHGATSLSGGPDETLNQPGTPPRQRRLQVHSPGATCRTHPGGVNRVPPHSVLLAEVPAEVVSPRSPCTSAQPATPPWRSLRHTRCPAPSRPLWTERRWDPIGPQPHPARQQRPLRLDCLQEREPAGWTRLAQAVMRTRRRGSSPGRPEREPAGYPHGIEKAAPGSVWRNGLNHPARPTGQATDIGPAASPGRKGCPSPGRSPLRAAAGPWPTAPVKRTRPDGLILPVSDASSMDPPLLDALLSMVNRPLAAS